MFCCHECLSAHMLKANCLMCNTKCRPENSLFSENRSTVQFHNGRWYATSVRFEKWKRKAARRGWMGERSSRQLSVGKLRSGRDCWLRSQICNLILENDTSSWKHAIIGWSSSGLRRGLLGSERLFAVVARMKGPQASRSAHSPDQTHVLLVAEW